jgi:hypothetical protein
MYMRRDRLQGPTAYLGSTNMGHRAQRSGRKGLSGCPAVHRTPDMLRDFCSVCRITLTGVSSGRILVRRTTDETSRPWAARRETHRCRSDARGLRQKEIRQEGRPITLVGSGCSDRNTPLWPRPEWRSLSRSAEASNITLERTEGSPALAPAAQRERWAASDGLARND